VKESVDPWANTSETAVTLRTTRVRIVHPSNSDDLISEDDYVRDERLPYWADIWPASRVLAEEILAAEDAAGRNMLELGCGLGLVSLAAVLAGFRVVASDYYKPALEFAAHNVRENTGGELQTLHWNWREPFPAAGKFDCIVASDILYEREYALLVADIVRDLLAPGGSALIADPGRAAANDFLDLCATRGARIMGHKRVAITDDGRDQTINVYRLQNAPCSDGGPHG
jgi:predicted nicotinamide N-methyase